MMVVIAKPMPDTPKLDTRTRMIVSATELFRENGYSGTGFREVVEHSGAPRGSIYHHFGDKRSLYLQAHLREFGKSSARLEAAIERGDTAAQRLLSFTTELCRVLSEPGPLFKLVARHWIEGDPDVVRSLAQATVPEQFRRVRSAIRELAPERHATAMALSIYAVNNGYMDKVARNKVVDFEAALQAFAKASHKATLDAINAKPELKAHEAAIKKICEDFAATGAY